MTLALRMPQQRHSRRRAWVFFPMLIAFAIIIGIAVYGIVSPYEVKPAPPAPGQRGALVWGDGIFSNPAQVRAWLKLHGADYWAWRKAHPAALALIKPRKHHAVPARAKPAIKPATKAAAPAAAPVSSPVARPANNSGELVRWLFAAFGLLLAVCAAFTPRRLFTRVVKGPLQSEGEMRLAVAGAAIAVLGGVAVAALL